MKSSYLVAVIILSFVSFAAQAQAKRTVSGYVRDSLSAEPLVGVTVSATPQRATSSNQYGFFSITLTEQDTTLTFSSITHKVKQYRCLSEGKIELDIKLVPVYHNIDEVVVMSAKKKMVDMKSLGAYAVNLEQLKYIPSFMGEKDVFKYFQLLPGVNPGKEGTSGMNLRGGSTDQTLILIDEIPIYNSAHAFGFVSIFSGDYIKSAELYKGYIPSQFGERLSGVATMNVREGNRNKHEQSLQVGTTTFSALLEGPLARGKGSYLVGGRYFVPNLFLNAIPLFADKNNSSYPIIGFYDATAKISYDLGKNNTIYGSFYTGRDAIDFKLNDMSYAGEGEALRSKASNGLAWGNIVGSIRLSSRLSNKCFMNTTAYYSHLSNRQINDYRDSGGTILNMDTRSEVGEAGLKINFDHNVTDWYELNYGLNMSYRHFIPQDVALERNGAVTKTQYGERELYTGSLFIDNRFRVKDFLINVGGRVALYNNNNQSKAIFEPRASVTYYNGNSSFWTSYSVNSQPLFSIYQMTYSIPLDYWIPFQNKNELPQSYQFSAGYKQRTNIGLDFQVEAYYKKSRNLSFVYNVDDFLMDEGGYKIGTGQAYGFEFLAQYTRDRLNVMASYTYSKSVHNIEGKVSNFIFDTPHNLNIFGSYETVRKSNVTHTLSININYKTGLPYILSNTVYPEMEGPPWDSGLVNYPEYANTRLPAFFRVDLNYAMEKKLRKGSRVWQLSIMNATASRNPYLVYNDNGKYKAFVLIPFLPSFSYVRKF